MNKGLAILVPPLALLLCGCQWMAAWFFVMVPGTRGTWTGVVSIERLACDAPEHATADAMVLRIDGGTPIKTYISGTPPHTDSISVAGVRVVVIDRASSLLLMRRELAGKLVRVHGVITRTHVPIDPVSGLGMLRYAGDKPPKPGESLQLLKVISADSLRVID
jgi:hypothetical protein